MSFDILVALATFTFVASLTPGPNNVMLLASGVNYGFWRSLPHVAGIVFGFTFMIGCIAFGLGEILERAPVIYTGLKIAGATYLVYLAWRIATSGKADEKTTKGRPFTFLEASAFQWVNPKAWVMAVTAVAVYADPENYTVTASLVVLFFLFASLTSTLSWCGFGVVLREWLSDPKRLRIFNILMALLLIASLWPMLR